MYTHPSIPTWFFGSLSPNDFVLFWKESACGHHVSMFVRSGGYVSNISVGFHSCVFVLFWKDRYAAIMFLCLLYVSNINEGFHLWNQTFYFMFPSLESNLLHPGPRRGGHRARSRPGDAGARRGAGVPERGRLRVPAPAAEAARRAAAGARGLRL